MNRAPHLISALVTVIGFCGCQSARYVMRDADHGVVAIPRDTDSWPTHHRTDADELMARHFPGGYIIDREEEHVIGTRTHHSGSGGGPAFVLNRHVGFSVGSYSGTAETVDQTEWRIYYRRLGAPPVSQAKHEELATEVSDSP